MHIILLLLLLLLINKQIKYQKVMEKKVETKTNQYFLDFNENIVLKLVILQFL